MPDPALSVIHRSLTLFLGGVDHSAAFSSALILSFPPLFSAPFSRPFSCLRPFFYIDGVIFHIRIRESKTVFSAILSVLFQRCYSIGISNAPFFRRYFTRRYSNCGVIPRGTFPAAAQNSTGVIPGGARYSKRRYHAVFERVIFRRRVGESFSFPTTRSFEPTSFPYKTI